MPSFFRTALSLSRTHSPGADSSGQSLGPDLSELRTIQARTRLADRLPRTRTNSQGPSFSGPIRSQRAYSFKHVTAFHWQQVLPVAILQASRNCFLSQPPIILVMIA